MEQSKKKLIDAKNITIYEYLNESKNIIIPRYQRAYSWDKSNIMELFQDLKEKYYIGNIIECINEKNATREIIDGQQRLITIFLTFIAIYNQTHEESIKKLLCKDDEKCKLQLKARIANDGIDILDYLLNNDKIPIEMEKKYNELKMYKIITKELKKQNILNIKKYLEEANIVRISFLENEYDAHEMFVNVNTKGKPLELIEILKSQLFKYLFTGKNTDIYKENWQRMLNEIPEKEYDSYCSDVYLLDYFNHNKGLEKYTTNGVVRENGRNLINSIDNQERANEIFELMTGSEINNLFCVYSAIKNHNLANLKNTYYSNAVSTISFGGIDTIWSLIGESKFKQSDIFFMSIFWNKERFIVNEIEYIYVLMKYIFMYELYRSVAQKSPANYANCFKQAAARIVSEKEIPNIKNVIKEFMKSFYINNEDFDRFKSLLTDDNTFNASKLRTGKLIIMMTEEFYTKNLTTEHFIYKKTKDSEEVKIVGNLGNLIPVSNDKYKNKSIGIKLKQYESDRIANKGIDNFLKYEFNEDNYLDKIHERCENIASNFISKMKEYYEKILKG